MAIICCRRHVRSELSCSKHYHSRLNSHSYNYFISKSISVALMLIHSISCSYVAGPPLHRASIATRARLPLVNITNSRPPLPQQAAGRAYSEAQGGSVLPGRGQARAGRGMPRPDSRSGCCRRSGSERHAVDIDPPASGSPGQLRPLISMSIVTVWIAPQGGTGPH